MGRSGGRGFQAEGTAHVKVLRQKHAECSRIHERACVAGGREEGQEEEEVRVGR